MTLKICDECGITFKPTDHGVSKVKLFVYDSNHLSWPDGCEYDFCVTCTEKMKRILKALE